MRITFQKQPGILYLNKKALIFTGKSLRLLSFELEASSPLPQWPGQEGQWDEKQCSPPPRPTANTSISSKGLLGAAAPARLSFCLSLAHFEPRFPPALGKEHPSSTMGQAGRSTTAPSQLQQPTPSLNFHFFLLAEARAEDMTVYAQVGPSQQVSPLRLIAVLLVCGWTGLHSWGVPAQDRDGLGAMWWGRDGRTVAGQPLALSVSSSWELEGGHASAGAGPRAARTATATCLHFPVHDLCPWLTRALKSLCQLRTLEILFKTFSPGAPAEFL